MSKYYTAMGKISVALDPVKRIRLFTGQYNEGYKIVYFSIAPSNYAVDPDVVARVTTYDPGTLDARTWDWGDNREIAWAALQSNGANATGYYYSDYHDALVIEDIYVAGYSSTNQAINYKIILEKVPLKEYQSSLAIVNNMSQG